jgi:predicted Zn-dependent protease
MNRSHFFPTALALACALSCSAEKPPELPPGVRPLEEGLSQHHMEITAKPLAQKYFDQGMRLVYAFNHAEAIRAFEAAQKLDPDCAMCYWGVSLALGPNINAPMEASATKPALEALAKASERAPKVSAREQAYVKALATRYSDAPDADRAALDKAYAGAMRELVKQYPDDLDAATLFAESLMDLTPWAYWTKRGEATEYTAEIVAQIERVLAANPNHPGANHYYIHAVEASGEPGKALASAKRLESLAPVAGHLVHMPAHTYMRVGRYREASLANEKGAQADEAYMAWCKSGGFYVQAYYPHNLHFLWASETFEGKSAASLATAKKLAETITADAARAVPPAHELYAVRYFAPVRFGKWDEILAAPAPPEDLRYATGMHHWARGMALAGTDKLDEAAAEKATLAAIAGEDAVKSLVFLEGPASQLLEVATHLLAAEIASKQGKSDEALAELEQAQGKEYSLGYTEPPGWPLPVRQYQGAALLDAGRAAEAEAVFREDLADHPENGWALYGLAASLRAQDKPADDVEARFKTAWAGADVQLTRPRF